MTPRIFYGISSLVTTLLVSQAALAEISKKEAALLVQNEINKTPPDCVLLPEKTRTEKFGFVFFYTSKKYNESHNSNDIVPGMGPIAVEKDGTLTHLSSSVDPDTAIRIFGDAIKTTHGREELLHKKSESTADSGHMKAKEREQK